MQSTEPKYNNKIGQMDKDIHMLNYRIAFDAMRAYHTSEIEHKKDAISVLNAILASMIPVFGGVIYYILSDHYSLLIACIMVVIVILGYWNTVNSVVDSVEHKIKGDNRRYEQYRNEAIAARKILKLDMDLKAQMQNEYESLYWSENGRDHSGHNNTNGIIERYASILKGVTIFFIVIAAALILNISGVLDKLCLNF